MKKLLLLLLLSVSMLTFAKVQSSITDSFSKYERESMIGRYNIDFLRKFVGDTISFNFNSQYLDGFTVEQPDTVWIKKRPKKNAQLGKHFILNYTYKGMPVGENFLTPSSVINNTPFVVYSVTPHTSGEGCFVTLLDL